jgi:hypothetical protein
MAQNAPASKICLKNLTTLHVCSDVRLGQDGYRRQFSHAEGRGHRLSDVERSSLVSTACGSGRVAIEVNNISNEVG